jgi:hypothetical protein
VAQDNYVAQGNYFNTPIYEETEHIAWIGRVGHYYWSGQNISAGMGTVNVGTISADLDASGQPEVYVAENGFIPYSGNLYLYDQESWTQKDYYVNDIAAAGGGYFYDVNYYGSGPSYGYQWNPYTDQWTYLGSDLQ